VKDQLKQLAFAIRLAALAHKDQTDKAGEVYILHPLTVMEAVAPNVPAMTIAVLHDVIEDTDVTEAYLRSEGFDPLIVDVVAILTRRKDEEYSRYIRRVAEANGYPGMLARAVKRADLEDNLAPERLEKLDTLTRSKMRLKYEPALERVRDAQ